MTCSLPFLKSTSKRLTPFFTSVSTSSTAHIALERGATAEHALSIRPISRAATQTPITASGRLFIVTHSVVLLEQERTESNRISFSFGEKMPIRWLAPKALSGYLLRLTFTILPKNFNQWEISFNLGN